MDIIPRGSGLQDLCWVRKVKLVPFRSLLHVVLLLTYNYCVQ